MTPNASETINQRFAQLIKQLGLNKNAFAQSLGKTASVIQHLMDGRNKPGYDLLCKVFEVYPNVSRDWLLLGNGPMMLEANGSSTNEEAPLTATPPAPASAPMQEVLDFAEPVVSAPRRPAAGSHLQPADIAATLALAASAAAPARTPIPAPPAQHQAAGPSPEKPSEISAPASLPAQVPAPSTVLSEASLALALQTQHLQHQLALAELRNQHLLEQQQLLREMLELTRKSV